MLSGNSHNMDTPNVQIFTMPQLSELLAINKLSLIQVVRAHGDPDITWAATSELADPTPHLDGGELLLTTGLGTLGWNDEWSGFAASLARAGVPAIGFGTGLTYAQVPVGLQEAARAEGLAVIEVPRQTPFIAIGRALAELLAQTERTALADALAVQRDLTRSISLGPNQVIDRLARILGGSAAVLDADNGIIIASGPALPAETTEQLGRIRALGLRGATADLNSTHSLIVQPLGLSGTPGRYLAVAAPGPWSPAQRSAITTAVAILSLDAERATDRRVLVRRVTAGIVALVLGGQPGAAATLFPIISATSALPPRLRVLRCVPSGDADELIRIIERDNPTGSIASEVEGQVVVLAAIDRAEAIAQELVSAGALVGMGSGVPVADAAAGDASARAALSHSGQNRMLVRFDEIATTGVQAALGADAGLAFANATLAPILAQSSEREMLLMTARVFLDNNGARQPTSVQLGVHRNTLFSRVNRLEQLLGRSLDDPQCRADLWVALQTAHA